MFVQVLLDPEAFGAEGAGEGLLPCVEAQMALQVFSESEALAAVQAAVGSLSGVEPLVTPHALAQREGFSAAGAGVRPLARVETFVSPQDLPPLELLAADLAAERVPVRRVPLQAPHAVLARGEAAQPPSRVGALVGAEVFGRGGGVAPGRGPPGSGPGDQEQVDKAHAAGLQQFAVGWRLAEPKLHRFNFGQRVTGIFTFYRSAGFLLAHSGLQKLYLGGLQLFHRGDGFGSVHCRTGPVRTA